MLPLSKHRQEYSGHETTCPVSLWVAATKNSVLTDGQDATFPLIGI